MSETADDRVTAAVLVIGDEILSGRTQDTNTRDIARYLGVIGVDLAETRTVPDVMQEIVDALNALRSRYDYVITTGGITSGPIIRCAAAWNRVSPSPSLANCFGKLLRDSGQRRVPDPPQSRTG